MSVLSPPLEQMLRPAGAGIHVVSTGVAELLALQEKIYSVKGAAAVQKKWQADLLSAQAPVRIIGVPSDTGAGFRKGANHGPNGIRTTLLDRPESRYHGQHVVDLGDVFCIPHLLSEDMLSDEQRARCFDSVYGDGTRVDQWPVTPLGLTYSVLENLYAQNHSNRPIFPLVLGGDHSVGWPAFRSAFEHWEQRRGHRIGILHFDAHTDLLPSRLGVDYCFATWAFHANELLNRDGRLYQVGIRSSAKTKAHWESALNVRQMWACQARELTPHQAATMIIEQFERTEVEKLYISNDIDGVDAYWASATGTPEADGLEPGWVSEVTHRVAEVFPLVAADLVEVAPTLEPVESEALRRTLDTAANFVEDFMTLFLTNIER